MLWILLVVGVLVLVVLISDSVKVVDFDEDAGDDITRYDLPY